MSTAGTARATVAVRQSRAPLPNMVLALRILLGVIFLAIGAANLFGAGTTVEMFDQIGLGQWLRYFTGTLQVLGGVFVLIPVFSGVGSFILTVVMVGASLFLATGVPGNALVAIVLLLCSSASFVQTQVW
jgi:putative oxidoreductase